MDKLSDLMDAIFEGDEEQTVSIVKELLEQGWKPEKLLIEGLTPGLERVGDKFRTGDVFIPEILASVRAFQQAVDILQPLYEAGEGESGRFLIGTVKGDIHDVGKNLVAMMVSAAGFEVLDIGVDVDPDEFVAKAQQFKPNVVGMSALLTTTMPYMEKTINALRDAGMSDVKVIVGGAPVSTEFADKIGADGFAVDAMGAADLVKRLAAS